MPLVRIEMWPTDRERKNTLIRKVTDAVVEAVGCPEDAVQVMLFEVPKEDWATAGQCHAERFPDWG